MKMRLMFELSFAVLVYLAVSDGEHSHYRRVHVRPGRHVCLSETVKSRPIPVTETYKKAVYTPRRRNCPYVTSCPQFDVTYVTATKKGYHLQKTGTFTQDCCPGWTTSSKREKGCMEPICESGCGEFGHCVQPGFCRCPAGFQGENCDTDIDECRSRDHGCHHFCANTAGSYLCGCQNGFSLAEDGKTCIYCFTCSKEYIAMQTELKQIQQELKISRVLCRSANFETAKLKYRVGKMTTQTDQLEQGLYNNTLKNVEMEHSLIQMAEKLNETLDIVDSFNPISKPQQMFSTTASYEKISESFDTPKMDSTPPSAIQTSQEAYKLPFIHAISSGQSTEASLLESDRILQEYTSTSSTHDSVPMSKGSSQIADTPPSTVSDYSTMTVSRPYDPNETVTAVTTGTTQSVTSRKPSIKLSKFPEMSKPTSRRPGQEGFQHMPLFLYDRFASLSQQIGLLEERIGTCACSERPRR